MRERERERERERCDFTYASVGSASDGASGAKRVRGKDLLAEATLTRSRFPAVRS